MDADTYAQLGEKSPGDIAKFYDEVIEQTESFNQAATPESTDLLSQAKGSDLVEEARKYDTASIRDKFPDLSKAMYRTSDEVKVYRGEGKGIGNSTFVQGEYWADSKKFAETFGDVTEGTIPKNAAVFDFDKIKNDPNQTIIPKELLVDQKGLTDYLLKRGVEYTKNTNSRGVEIVKLNKQLFELEKKALTMSQSEFKKFVTQNYDKYRNEISRRSRNYTNADRSRMRRPIDDIWKEANE